MKIAAFYSASPFAGWVQTEGFVDVLKRMGHEVTGIGVPPVSKISRQLAEKINQPIDDCELIIVSGPEHLHKWINTFYKDWGNLKVTKVAWYHESFVREDYSLDFKTFEAKYDFHFFPDNADAAKYKGEWLPLGVDTQMFDEHPWPEGYSAPRDIPVAFIGLMYPKRAQFVDSLKPHLGDIEIKYMTACQSERGLIPAIGTWDAEGLNIRLSTYLLAATYRRIKTFVTFPSLSNVLVAKVLEAMACGCSLVAPKQSVELEGYFPYGGAYQCAQAIRESLSDPRNGAEFVRKHHSMELRFEEIFKKVGITCPTYSSRALAALLATG